MLFGLGGGIVEGNDLVAVGGVVESGALVEVDLAAGEGGELLHHRCTEEPELTSKVVGTNRPAAIGPNRLREKVRKLLHRQHLRGQF